MQGPDFNTLVGILTRFREGSVALMSDIEFMFHKVGVTPEHCDALRHEQRASRFSNESSFIWWSVIAKLHKTAKDNSQEFPVDVVETVNKNFYVDDCLKAVENENTAIKLVPKIRTREDVG